ncbi:MAG: type II toxin-antitoxin system RelE/ParE family toxin [Proteobacteria bacterium]|nr:type II toxin-antitoxin system RelE/ParE family toxin [Pseudomonadota bacterium]
MVRLHWLADALEDLKRLHGFIKPYSEEAAIRAVTALVAAAKSREEFPEKGRPWEADADYRELPVQFGAKGYVIRYRLHEDRVIIVRVWHGLQER